MRNNFANLLALSGQPQKAIVFFEENLIIQRQIFGPQHFYTLDTMRNIAQMYYDKKDYQRAEVFFRLAFEGQLNNQPLETPITLLTGLSLMETLLKLNRREEASNIAKRLAPPFRSGLLEREGINSELKAFMVEVLGQAS